MTPPVVVCDGVACRFGDRIIFENVSFAVGAGEVFVVLGGSGAGKSTLMRILVGLQTPSAGRVALLGRDVDDQAQAMPACIGVMFQAGALFGSLSLLENVMLPLRVHTALPAAAREAIALVKLGLVGLADAAALRPAELSGGMVKRAAIARALALDPPLLFLDEPAAGLDPVTSAGLDRLILELRDALGTTVVVVSHDLGSILAIGDRCLMLDAGARGVIATGDPRALRDGSADPRVRAFFRRDA